MAPIAVSCPSDSGAVLEQRKHATESTGVLPVENAATQPLVSTVQRCAAFAGCKEQPQIKPSHFPGEVGQHSRPKQSKQARRKVGSRPASAEGLMSKSASQV